MGIERLLPVALFCLVATSSVAGPNPQLLSLIENRIARYDLPLDPARLNNRQAAALHLTLSNPTMDYLEKRRRLKTILRWENDAEGDGADGRP